MGLIVGIDEAGRGCWAGPLVAAAVLLHKPVKGLADSKQLSRSQREKLSLTIYENADVGLGWIESREIDKIGLTAATTRVMTAALGHIKYDYDEIVIDGNFNYLHNYGPISVLPKADALIPAVSAASIVAKVARDEFMYAQAKLYPEYRFEKHVGYGTALHLQLIQRHGLCQLHRRSYKPIQALI